jgi:AcrR family transcriptional regulator
MATGSSVEKAGEPSERRQRRHRETVQEALDHAVAVMGEAGVGGLSISEVARRMGMRGPSLYKYFPSLHAMYDALFVRGVAENRRAAWEAMEGLAPGLPRIRAGARATVRWCVENQALAQLLYWRPVPGFEPSADSFSASVDDMREARNELAAAVACGQLHPRADSDEALRLLTVVLSGLISQQMANEPAATWETGRFTRLTDAALDMFCAHHQPQEAT